MSVGGTSVPSLSERHVRRDQVRWGTRPAAQERRVVQVFQSEFETRPTAQGFIFSLIHCWFICFTDVFFCFLLFFCFFRQSKKYQTTVLGNG